MPEADRLAPALASPASGSDRTRSLATSPILAAFCLVVAIAKLWIVSGNEIVAQATPYDQLRFAEMADHLIAGRWLGPYDEFTLIREPAYPLWIWLVHSIGLRLHLAIEVLLIVSAIAFAASLLRARVRAGIAGATYAAIVLQPYSIQWNCELRAETLYAPVLLLALATMIHVLVDPGRRRAFLHSVLAGLALAVLWHTREETLVLVPAIGVFALLVVWRLRRGGASTWASIRRATMLTAVPCVFILGASLGIRAINHAHYGVSVVTELESPSFLAARRAMLRIRPEHSRRFCAVPADARRLGYTASPALAEVEPFIEGDVGKKWRDVGCRAVGMCDDIADAWLFWGLREAAALAGHHRSAPEAAAYYQRVADEIDAACDDGRVPSRRVLSSALNPDARTWLRHLLPSIYRVARVSWHPAYIPGHDSPSATPDVRALFDRIARRDPSRTSFGAVRVRGFAFDLADPIVKVALRGADGTEIASTTRFVDRPEVVQHFSRRGASAPLASGFTLDSGASPSGESGATALVFVKQSGAESVVTIEEVVRNWMPFCYGIDDVEEPGLETRRAVEGALRIAQIPVMIGLNGALVAALVGLLLWRRRFRLDEPARAIVVLLAAVIVPRVLVLALITASAFPGSQSRYVYPMLSLHVCAAAMLVEAAVRTALERRRSA